MGKGKGKGQSSIPLGPNQIQPGTYKITNPKNGVALDYLALAADKSKIIVSYSHPSENQKWDVMPLGQGCTIRNANTQLYLTVEAGIANEVPIVANPNPASWHIVPVSAQGAQDGAFKITWPTTQFVFDLYRTETHSGTKVHLYSRYEDEFGNQKWKFERCNESRQVTSLRTSVFTITTTSTSSVLDDSDADSDCTL